MSKYFLIISTLVALPANIFTMDNKAIIVPALHLNNANTINADEFKNYQHENTPRTLDKSKNTPSKNAVTFNDLINEFGKAQLEKNEPRQSELHKKINRLLKNENKLNGYYPVLLLRELTSGTIRNNTPLQTAASFAQYNMNPIQKNAYLEFCAYTTRNKPLHKHIVFIKHIYTKTNQLL